MSFVSPDFFFEIFLLWSICEAKKQKTLCYITTTERERESFIGTIHKGGSRAAPAHRLHECYRFVKFAFHVKTGKFFNFTRSGKSWASVPTSAPLTDVYL